MGEDFSIEKFKKHIDILCTEFPTMYTIFETTDGQRTTAYKISVGDEHYGISDISNPTGKILVFYYEQGTFGQILGSFDLENCTINTKDFDNPLLVQLENDDQLYLWDMLICAITEVFTKHAEKFILVRSEDHTMPPFIISKNDMTIALEKSFEAYSSFDKAESYDNERKVITLHDNIRVGIQYTETDGKHDSIFISVDYVIGKYVKEFFTCDYFFAEDQLFYHNGAKPAGFDKGITKFRLLGSLMT